jgi:hypothetical protein
MLATYVGLVGAAASMATVVALMITALLRRAAKYLSAAVQPRFLQSDHLPR